MLINQYTMAGLLMINGKETENLFKRMDRSMLGNGLMIKSMESNIIIVIFINRGLVYSDGKVYETVWNDGYCISKTEKKSA